MDSYHFLSTIRVPGMVPNSYIQGLMWSEATQRICHLGWGTCPIWWETTPRDHCFTSDSFIHLLSLSALLKTILSLGSLQLPLLGETLVSRFQQEDDLTWVSPCDLPQHLKAPILQNSARGFLFLLHTGCDDSCQEGSGVEVGNFPDPERGLEFTAASARAFPRADSSQNHFLWDSYFLLRTTLNYLLYSWHLIRHQIIYPTGSYSSGIFCLFAPSV